MANEALIVEIVQFSPTKRCLTDPSLFKAVRDLVERWQERGMKGQYWGTAVEKPNKINWVLFWQSRAHVTAFVADPLYPEFVQRRQSLATAPVRDLHVALSRPRPCIEAPITDITIYKAADTHAEAMHEGVLCAIHNLRSIQPPGFHGASTGVTDEDPTIGVNMCGWNTVEEHMRVGMEEGQEEFRAAAEGAMGHMCEVNLTHIAFKKHSA